MDAHGRFDLRIDVSSWSIYKRNFGFKEQKENYADKDGEKSTCCGCKLRPFLKIEIYLSSK